MPREKPSPYTARAKKEPVPESGPDRVTFKALLDIVDRKIGTNKKNLGEPKDPDAHKRRIEEAVELALNSKNLAGTRRRQFQSYLMAELGRRGGEAAAEKRMTDAELDRALRLDYVTRQIQEHAAQYGPDNGLDDTENEREAKA